MLTDDVLAPAMTSEHRILQRAANRYFTPERLATWIEPDTGSLGRRAWRQIGAAGYLGVPVPMSHGGRSLGLLGSVLMCEATARLGDAGVQLGLHVQSDVAARWLLDAEPALRDHYLHKVLDGSMVACQCDTDPAADEPTVATRDGDELVINGAKRFVINGAVASLCFVRVLLDGTPVIAVVEKDQPGVHVTKVYDKLGTRAVDSAALEFRDVRVPSSRVLRGGGPGQLVRWNRVMSRMRFLIAVDAYLIHERLLTHVVRHTTGRELGGRPMADWPVNGHLLARARADLELMGAGIAGLLGDLERGVPCVPEAAQLKWFCVERACALAAACADLEGGAGYMWTSRSLNDYAQLRGLRMAGGSQTTMLTVANHTFASRAELAALPNLLVNGKAS